MKDTINRYVNPSVNTQVTIKDLTPWIDPTWDLHTKETIVNRVINPNRYAFLGMLDRTSKAILGVRFHNVRDNKGRFAKVLHRRRTS